MAALLRVHLADDHTMFREGLAALLSSEGGVEVVGASPTGEAAAALVRETKPDVVITQLDMQLKTAEEILGAIRSASPSSKIVVLTLFDNLRYMQAIAAMGIDAILHKSSSAEELIDTLGVLSREPGGKNAVVSLPRNLFRSLGGGGEAAGGLSERETEVLVLAARGFSNRRIAGELHISEATVKRHLANIYQKVGVRSRNEAVRKAMVEEWLGIEEITGDGKVRR
jgi:DNA-binding NarL/FixJ family response regulator